MEACLSKLYSELENDKYWNVVEHIKYESKKYYDRHLPKPQTSSEETNLTTILDDTETNLTTILDDNLSSRTTLHNTQSEKQEVHEKREPQKWNVWGKFGIKLFGVCIYIYDVFSDVLSGSSYVSGNTVEIDYLGSPNHTEYRDDVCANLVYYSHPVWGILTIGLAWLPCLCLLFVLWSALWSKSPLKTKHLRLGCFHLLVYIFWPICGVIM